MNRHVYQLALLLITATGFAGCTAQREVVSSQTQSNWAQADPSAMASAEPEAERDIMPETHFAAGQLFEKQGAAEKAIVQYQKTLAGNPKHVGALNRLGVLYSGMGRHADAENVLRRAVDIQPDSSPLRNNLGFEYVMQQNWTQAETQFRKAIALSPDFRRAHINLGLCLAKLDRFDESLDMFRRVLPEPDAYYNLGLMFRAEHRYQDAANAFQLALDFNPKFVAARKQLELIQPQLQLSNPLEPTLDEGQLAAMIRTPAMPTPVVEQPATVMAPADAPPMEPVVVVAVVDAGEVVDVPDPIAFVDNTQAMAGLEDDAASPLVTPFADILKDDCLDNVMTVTRSDTLEIVAPQESRRMAATTPTGPEVYFQALTGDADLTDPMDTTPKADSVNQSNAMEGGWSMLTDPIESFLDIMAKHHAFFLKMAATDTASFESAEFKAFEATPLSLSNLPSDLLPIEENPLLETSWKRSR